MKFKIYEPEQSGILAQLQNQLGFVPNVFAVLGENDHALQAFASLNALFAESGLSPLEREIVQAAVSVVNECGYCIAGHTAFTDMASLEPAAIQLIRDRQPIQDDKLEALRRFTESVATTYGKASEPQIEEFEAAGYTRSQVFAVILGVVVKTFSNSVVGVTNIPLDGAFVPYAWNPAATVTPSSS